jgi:hypothetical protein
MYDCWKSNANRQFYSFEAKIPEFCEHFNFIGAKRREGKKLVLAEA